MPGLNLLAIALAIIGSTIIGQTSVNAQPSTNSIDEAQKKKIFQNFTELFFKGHCKDACLTLDKRMQNALPEESMRVVLNQLKKKFGNFQSVNNIRLPKTAIQGMTSMQATCLSSKLPRHSSYPF